MLEKFRVAKFRFTVCAKEPIRFPAYPGAVFYSSFGYAFKRVVCAIRGKECNGCLLKRKCIYSYIFETPPPGRRKNAPSPPKGTAPFIIEHLIAEKQSFASIEKFPFPVIFTGQMWYLQKVDLSRKYKK